MVSLNQKLYNLDDTDLSFYTIDNEDNISKRWDEKAKYWDKQLFNINNSHLNQDNEYNRFINICKELSNSKNIDRIIDIGCGTGLVLESLQNNFKCAIGIDISKSMIEEAKKKNISNTKFYQESLFKIDNNFYNKFDMTISRGILISHYGKKYLNQILQIFYKLTKDKGFVIFDFLNKDVKREYEHLPKNKEYYSKEEIKQYALKNNFKKIKIIGNNQNRVLIGILYK